MRGVGEGGGKMGRRFLIDEGMGVVMGERCEMGKNVRVFEGVRVGGRGKEKGKRDGRMEEDGVI